jgi:hypothetical protein
MDPTICYLGMYRAMCDKDYETARDYAIALRNWLADGGFCPPNYSRVEVICYLRSVLSHLNEYPLPTL